MRTFNTEGQCIPGLHYMVNIETRLADIKRQIDAQKYLYVQQGRQYGKTTLLMALEDYVKEQYIVLPLDFQRLGSADFLNEHVFSVAFTECLNDLLIEQPEYVRGLDLDALTELKSQFQDTRFGLSSLFRGLRRMCMNSARSIVLMIDEVDSASNNQVFLDFLAQLRDGYLRRQKIKTFQSVILAGVYDIQNLKKKIRSDEEHDKNNSPWNIAAKFAVDMNFSVADISGMLKDYEADHHTGMKLEAIAQIIFDYTSGYPYLVSKICQIVDDESLKQEPERSSENAWEEEGIIEAVKILLKSDAPLFGSLIKQLDRYPDLKEMIRNVLFKGQQIPFSPDIESINLGLMFGYLKGKNNLVSVANRIFEMRLMNMYIAEAASNSEAYQMGLRDKNQFIKNGRLDMDRVMNKFVQFYGDVFADKDEKYVENFGREIFLMYLKPIINGTGNSYQESTTRTMTRTDVIVDYLGEQFVIEMKIWHGQEYNNRGEQQLCDYLDFYHKKKGYLLSFNFNKRKTPGVQEIRIGDKVIVEAVV